jgi:ATP-dependent Zn protease
MKTPDSFESLTRVSSDSNDIFKMFDISRKNSPFKLETKKSNRNILLFSIGTIIIIIILILLLIAFLIKKYYIDRKKDKE